MPSAALTLDVAHIVAQTEAEGPGHRMAIWLQGCPLRCPGCCNPEMLPLPGEPGGEAYTRRGVDQLAAEIAARSDIEGISLLGGEPFAQAQAAAALATRVRAAGRTVMIYSGYRLDELRAMGPAAGALLAACDLLVDGRYDRSQPESDRRWIGSRNQLMHYLSAAYRPDDPRLIGDNTLEIRLVDGEVTVNGWPSLAAALRAGRRPR